MHQPPQGESIWGTINTCTEIALNIYMIISKDANGIEHTGVMAKKETAEKKLSPKAVSMAEQDGDWLCYDENTKDIPMYEILQRKMAACKRAEAAIMQQMEDIKRDGRVSLSDYFGECKPPVETPQGDVIDTLPIRNGICFTQDNHEMLFSEGMQGEVEFARENGIPAYFITHPLEPSYYPVSQDGNRLLTGMDSEDESRKKSYEEQWVILRHECLKPEYRTPLNQLWLCTHGPGCCPDYKHSDTIHLLHPTDGDSMAIARGQVWGVAKPETLERLAALYPALEERLAHHQEPAAEPDEDMSR